MRHMFALLPLSPGTLKFPFLLLLGCNGNKYSFVCGSAEPYIVALKAHKVLLQDGNKKLPE